MPPFARKPSAVTRIVRDTYKVNGQISGWYEIANEVRRRANFTCEDRACQKYLGPGRGDPHHIVPLSRGGTTTLRNLMLLCGDCHKRRHGHMHDPVKKQAKSPFSSKPNPFGRRRP